MPEVDQVIELPFDHGELKLKERWAFARKLRFSRYHRSFILPNSLKSALIPAMAVFLAESDGEGSIGTSY